MASNQAIDLPALLAAARAAKEQSGSGRWVVSDEREDGTAQVYSPNRGPLRVIVPVAETSRVCGEYIASLSPDAVIALVTEMQDERKANATELAYVDMSGREADAACIEEWQRRALVAEGALEQIAVIECDVDHDAADVACPSRIARAALARRGAP